MVAAKIVLSLCWTLMLAFGPVDGQVNWVNGYRENATFVCPGSQSFLTQVKSIHHNQDDDRLWAFQCGQPNNVVRGVCQWSGFINAYQKPMFFMCDKHHAITGVKSVFDDPKEDRIFSFLCCKVPVGKRLHTCTMTDFVNDFNGPIDYTVPENMLVTGVYSTFDDYFGDRMFRFQACRISRYRWMKRHT